MSIGEHIEEWRGKTLVITIAHLIPGGAERFTSEIASYAASVGVNVHLVLLFRKEKFFLPADNVNIVEPDFDYTSSNKIIYLYKLRKYIRKHVKSINPDAILSIGFLSVTVFCLLGLKYKLFISNRSNPLKPRPFWYRIIRKLMYSRATGIIAQTSIAKNAFFQSTGNKNICVIPNFVRNLPSPKQITSSKVIVTVGRLVSTKNHKALIRIISRIKDKDWRLVIVGGGPMEKVLYDYCIELNVKDRVIITGYTKDVDVWLQRASIFAFTSLSEGFPNSLIEAMATPLPCISYNCTAGPADVICDGLNGFLVKENDEMEFLEKLELLAASPELQVKICNESIKVREFYSLEKIGNRYLKFILN